MRIQFTASAVAKLQPELDAGKLLKLLYDTEGCGCVVSGVPALQLLDEPGEHDVQGEGEPLTFLHEPRFDVFFEPQLKVDYDTARGQFVLKSDNQIYTNQLQLVRGQAV